MVSISFKMHDASSNHERTFEGATTQEVLDRFDSYLHEIIPEMFNAEGPQTKSAVTVPAEVPQKSAEVPQKKKGEW